MKPETLLSILEEAAERLAIRLDYDDLRKGEVKTYGDAFTLRGQRHILIHKKMTTAEKADLLVDILARFDTEDIHLPPEVRKRLDAARQNALAAEVEQAGDGAPTP